MIKVILEALDNNPITPRTGKAKVQGECDHLPIEGKPMIVMYDSSENTESPGVRIHTDNVEQIENVIRFYDDARRAFKLTILNHNNH